MHSKPDILPTTTDVIPGVNISGYVNSEFGLGEGVRATIRALEAASIPFVINNCTFNTMHRKLDSTYTDFSEDNPYPVNIVQVNVDMINTFISSTQPEYFKNKYNIGFWAWELSDFPAEWLSAFNIFNEIWTPSSYCVEAIAPVSPLPVIKIMHSISLPLPSASKKVLELPENKFIFLFIFDFCSVLERKNPAAVIEAFHRAFGQKNENVLLVIKFSNAKHFPDKLKQLKALVDGLKNIQLIDGYLLKDELNALIYHCDCYVSLHRSEGFGLTIAEAMSYGKPVIATAYSANTEFMNISNSFPVKYSLVPIAEDYGPYKKGNLWAEADIDHATYLMQYVFNNYEEAKLVGLKAAEQIKLLLHPQVIGQKIRTRLEFIHQMNNQFSDISLCYAELQQKNAEIERLQALVTDIQSSKFWRLRNQWLNLKKSFLSNRE
jgi:glycosyltransferase involved in cell wall biosynthesis